jgi:2-polyprenyl-3-methyl-5-hydroxy-6-metoxy-1,4-benzoquinol methylase
VTKQPWSGLRGPTAGLRRWAASNPSEAALPAIAAQREYWETWNSTARDPDALNPWCERRADVMLSYLRSLDLPSPSILDLGCGSGWFSARLARYGKVTGVDLAESVIAQAQARGSRVQFMAGDLFTMDLPRNHFDVVVSQEVIAHVPDQAAYLHRAADALGPSGHLIITTPNKFVVERGDFFPQQPAGHIEHWLGIRQMRALLSARFRVLRWTTIIPMGDRGILRVINSSRLDSALSAIIGASRLQAIKEQVGLGYIMVALAQKRR